MNRPEIGKPLSQSLFRKPKLVPRRRPELVSRNNHRERFSPGSGAIDCQTPSLCHVDTSASRAIGPKQPHADDFPAPHVLWYRRVARLDT